MWSPGIVTKATLINLTVDHASEEIAAGLDLEIDRRMTTIERLRTVDDESVATEACHIPYILCPDLCKEDLVAASLYRMLEIKYGLKLGNSRQTLASVQASETNAALLDTEKGAPLLLLDRYTLLIT